MSRKKKFHKHVETKDFLKAFYIKAFTSKEEISNIGLNWRGIPNILGPYQTIQQAREFVYHTLSTMPSVLQKVIKVACIYSGRFYGNFTEQSRGHFVPEHLVETIDFTQDEVHEEGKYFFRIFKFEAEINKEGCDWRGPISVAGPYKDLKKTHEMLNWSLEVMNPQLRGIFKFAAIYAGKVMEDEMNGSKKIFKPDILIDIINIS